MAKEYAEMTSIEKMIEKDKENPKKVFVIGDPMTDVYIEGRLESCQDECTKLVKENIIKVPGGALNAARSLENWWARVETLADAGIRSVKTRFMVNGRIVFRFDDDITNFNFTKSHLHLMEMIVKWKPDGVLISDYDKGLITPEFAREVIGWCNENNIPCVCDAKRHPSIYKGAILKCNEAYYLKYLLDNTLRSFNVVVVTNGKHDPMLFAFNTPCQVASPLRKVKCVNHVGAGDCFSAHLMLALTYGFSLKEATAIANSAGRVYVQRPFNVPPLPSEIRADMHGDMID